MPASRDVLPRIVCSSLSFLTEERHITYAYVSIYGKRTVAAVAQVVGQR